MLVSRHDTAVSRVCVAVCVTRVSGGQLLGPDLRASLMVVWEALVFATSALEDLARLEPKAASKGSGRQRHTGIAPILRAPPPPPLQQVSCLVFDFGLTAWQELSLR